MLFLCSLLASAYANQAHNFSPPPTNGAPVFKEDANEERRLEPAEWCECDDLVNTETLKVPETHESFCKTNQDEGVCGDECSKCTLTHVAADMTAPQQHAAQSMYQEHCPNVGDMAGRCPCKRKALSSINEQLGIEDQSYGNCRALPPPANHHAAEEPAGVNPPEGVPDECGAITVGEKTWDFGGCESCMEGSEECSCKNHGGTAKCTPCTTSSKICKISGDTLSPEAGHLDGSCVECDEDTGNYIPSSNMQCESTHTQIYFLNKNHNQMQKNLIL